MCVFLELPIMTLFCSVRSIVNYPLVHTVPWVFIVVESLLAEMLRTPNSSMPLLTVASIFVELEKMPEMGEMASAALNKAVQKLYECADKLQPMLLDRCIDWFCYHQLD